MFIKFLRLDWLFWVYRLVDSCILLFSRDKNNGGLALLRLDAIGDFVLWLDSAKEYRRLYKGRRIVLIANSAWADWAARLPYWDEVWDVDLHRFTRNLAYRFKILLKVRQEGFEIMMQPTYSRTFHGDTLVWASAADQRIGSTGDQSNITAAVKTYGNYWYTQLIPASDQSLMELERNTEFISNLSGVAFKAAIPHLPESCISSLGLRPWPGSYIVLFPGASWCGKRWPLTHFAELSSRLHAELGLPFVLCGGSSDVALCEELGAELSVPFVNWANKTNLAELAEVIYRSRLLISNDTSAVHIATAVGTPAVCILGGGHHGRFLPYPRDLQGVKPLIADYPMPCFNCNWKCSLTSKKRGPMPCIEKISVEHVLKLSLDLSSS